MTELNTNLDIIPSGVAKTIRVSQYDHKSRNIIIRLLNNKSDFTIPSGSTVQIRGTKPSGKGFSYNCSFSGSKVTVEIMDQMTVEAGKIPCEIVLLNGDKILGSEVFNLLVEKTTLDPGTITSSDTFDSLVEGVVVKCVNENLIELYVDTELNIESEAPVANKVVTAKFKNITNNLASAIKGRICGPVVIANDVSPIEHNPIVKVHSKNLIPFPYTKNTVTVAGGTFTQQDDGGVLVSGTPTEYASIAIYSGKPLVTKGKITFSLQGEFSNVNGAIVLYGESDNVLLEKELWNGANSYTIDLDSYSTISKWLIHLKRSSNNLEMSGIVYPQIEIGDTATKYIKHVDVSDVLVSRYGKNLLNLTNSSRANCTINGTGVKASIDGIYYCELYVNYLKSAVQNSDGKYLTFSVGNTLPDHYIALIIMYTDGTYSQKTGQEAKSVTLLLDHQGRTVQHVIIRPLAKRETFTDTTTIIKDLMLEFSDKASPYEMYKGEGYTLNEDGIVNLTTVSPDMTVLTNKVDTVIECEYIRDSNKVIEKLTNAIIALGGSV